MGPRKPRNRGNVSDLHDWISWALEKHETRALGGQRALDPGEILDRQHGMRDAKTAEQPTNYEPCGIVGLDEAQYVIALLCKSKQCVSDCADAGTSRQTVVAALQRSERQLRAGAK